MGKSLSKVGKNAKSFAATSSGDTSVKVKATKQSDKKVTKPPKFAVNKPKNDKLERDLKRASKRKRTTKKERLEDMKPLAPPTVPQKSMMSSKTSVTAADNRYESKVLCEQDYDAMAVVKMKNLLTRDSDLFLLNQLLLSMQFYTNFER